MSNDPPPPATPPGGPASSNPATPAPTAAAAGRTIGHVASPANPRATSQAGPLPGASASPSVAQSWQRLSDQLTDAVAELADRTDLKVRIAPGAGHGAPGVFDPATAQIEIDGTLLQVPPHDARPGKVRDRKRYPVAWGVLVHEAAHARHTTWKPPRAASAELDAALLLEESRIEAAQLRRRRRDRRWLRAAVQKLIIDELDDHPTRWAAARTAALVLARTDAAVLTRRETAPLRRILDRVLGRRRVTRLRRIWRDAHQLADDDTAGMLACGRRWCELTDVDPDQAPPPLLPLPAGGSPRSTVNKAARSAIDAISAVANPQPATPPGNTPPPAPPPARPAARLPAPAPPGPSAAVKVFGAPGAGTPAPGKAQWTTRPATPAEHAAARRLTAQLEAAGRRVPIRTRERTVLPPGRLDPRQALSAEAQRQAGTTPTAAPWRRTRTRRPPQPHLHVGIAVDISQSMRPFLKPLATLAWVIAKATSNSGGRSATVTFGAHVTPISHPRQPVTDHVREFRPEKATLGAPLAIAALTETLELAGPPTGRPGGRDPNARILVLVTDAELPAPDTTTVTAQLTHLSRSGCLTVVIGPRGSSPLPGAHHQQTTTPAEAPAAITAAIRAALADWHT